MLTIKNKKLAEKIIKLAKSDQITRKRFRKSGEWNSKVDFDNTKIIKEIVAKYGWPTIRLVGKKASQFAWLLVQHADHNLAFQKRCLALIKKAYTQDPKSVDLKNIAYLTDRVLVHMGKKQLYGTQLRILKTGSVPLPIEDKKNLDARRQSMGLIPFYEYRLMAELNFLKK